MCKRVLALAAVITVLSSCVTIYKPEGVGGGYAVVALGGDRYRIDVRGTGFTGMQRIRDIAMVKAADIALSKNFGYFKVEDSGSRSEVRVGGSGGNVYSSNIPYFFLVVKLTADANDIDAKQTIDDLGPQVGYTK